MNEYEKGNSHINDTVRNDLPELCYSVLPGSHEVIVIKCNEKGYYRTDIPVSSKEEARALVDEYNGRLGITRAQEEAMMAGSMFGWNIPGADPRNYGRNGTPLSPKDR